MSEDSEDDPAKYITALMLNFRELMVELQAEGDHYRDKLAALRHKNRNIVKAIAAKQRIRDNSIIPASISNLRYQQNKEALINQIRSVMGSPVSAATARGAFIVLEGLDRVGKSTVATKLVEHLERLQKPVTYCRFPDRTTQVGQLINEFLTTSSKRVDNHVMHLLFSANRWEFAKRIRNTLYQGKTVIADRYSYSGIAYSSAKKDLPLKWCCEVEKGLPRPDLVIYLELPREAQYKRPGFGDERYETQDMQELVRLQYERVMDMSNETWLKVNVEDKSPEQILGELILHVKRCLESSSSKELGTLDFIYD
jgi:dTMP kinase